MTAPRAIRRICVYCGSSMGENPVYRETARQIGELLATSGIGLVYGGGNVGLMGVLADAALAAGGEVIGIIPGDLVRREVGHPGLTDLRIVGTMHERKALMADLSDAFLALPGGMGTLDELFEILTWAQLGIHNKPVGLLNTNNYYAPLIALLDHMTTERFLRPEHRALALVDDDATRLLSHFAEYQAPTVEKWLDRAAR
ncbi:MAG: TIGR00730 family Rossman fold protein [Thermomicrobiales bacterium]